ncbi:aldehyde dehydrogenase [Pseudodonghicola flavimaris]|uniref:Aldehyde dehydrogenase n=1 Tax=Pseudodonghicola flavimaris TaxID=3050036 RepID=A0ABT7EX28_9RHOB|nr:aldehyde dehydrogenase [Pseudodonghicola flavimaris]MDK3016844.1 aldehyde dehydrogenase [Pseudodonghicola flavimaris]
MTSSATELPIANPGKFYIDGQWVDPSTSRTIDVIEAATEELYFTVAEAETADVARAVDAARRAFDAGPWPQMPPRQRAQYLRAFARAMAERFDDIVQLWPRETGVIASIVPAVMEEVPAAFEYYADLAETYPFEQEVPTSSGQGFGMIVGEPVGVVGAIIPWNTPMHLAAWKLAPALLAGCTVVVKASPEAPGSAYVIAEIADRIGLPPGVVNVLTADRVASEALVTDPRVDKITFTGSTAVGKRIAGIMAERIGRYTLELGGKSAAVILDDMDIAEAADSLTAGACFVSGQICASLTRIIVPRPRHDDMLEALAERFSRVRVGNPYDAGVQMGPLASQRQRERVEGYVRIGQDEGATLAFGGKRPKGLNRGWFIEPTVFGNVDNASRLAQEEIFGPVISVIAAADEDDAIRLANDTVFGLNASVFTHDVDRARAVSRRLRAGTVGQNGNRADFGIGFGGVKQSGIGREGGVAGLLPYLENKTVVLDRRPAPAATEERLNT